MRRQAHDRGVLYLSGGCDADTITVECRLLKQLDELANTLGVAPLAARK